MATVNVEWDKVTTPTGKGDPNLGDVKGRTINEVTTRLKAWVGPSFKLGATFLNSSLKTLPNHDYVLKDEDRIVVWVAPKH